MILPQALTPILELNEHDYRSWRDQKLDKETSSIEEVLVPIKQPESLSKQEDWEIRAILAHHNFVIYKCAKPNSVNVKNTLEFASQLGVLNAVINPESNPSGVTTIEYRDAEREATRYIPYTDKALKWHTDGYYNPNQNQIRSFILHCHTAAESGGKNSLLNHEIAYAQLRNISPKLVEALCQNDAFTVPENRVHGEIIRPEFTGSVFSTDSTNGRLYMRYSQRSRNIHWKKDPNITEARRALNELLDQPNPWVIHVSLKPGEGILCNNILHSRSAFTNNTTHSRRLTRIRFNDRIADKVN